MMSLLRGSGLYLHAQCYLVRPVHAPSFGYCTERTIFFIRECVSSERRSEASGLLTGDVLFTQRILRNELYFAHVASQHIVHEDLSDKQCEILNVFDERVQTRQHGWRKNWTVISNVTCTSQVHQALGEAHCCAGRQRNVPMHICKPCYMLESFGRSVQTCDSSLRKRYVLCWYLISICS